MLDKPGRFRNTAARKIKPGRTKTIFNPETNSAMNAMNTGSTRFYYAYYYFYATDLPPAR